MLSKGTLGSLMKSHNFLCTNKDILSRASILGFPMHILCVDKIIVLENIYDITLHICNNLPSTGYTGRKMRR